jgi:hypothetical protein
MQELGVWITPAGTSEAYLEFEELPAWASGAIKGAMTGAATGAPGGLYGLAIGGLAGATIGAATASAPAASTPTAASSTPPGAATQPTDAHRVQVIQALQQFAAIVPTLVQLVAARAPGGKEFGKIGEGSESMGDSDWGPESFEGTWTLP